MRNKKKYALKGKISYFLLISFLLIFASALAIEIDDKDFGFKLTLPEGFDNFPPGLSRPNALYSFARYAADGSPTIIIGIERMRGVIGKEPLPEEGVEKVRKMLPPGAIVRQYQEEWKDSQVYGMETIVTQGDVTIYQKSLQIPLRGEAIQIIVLGPEIESQEISQVMKQLLFSLEGQISSF